MEFRDHHLVHKGVVDAGRQALLGAEQDAVSTLFQFPAQGPPLGEGHRGACDTEERTIWQIPPKCLCVAVQDCCVPNPDRDHLVGPLVD